MCFGMALNFYNVFLYFTLTETLTVGPAFVDMPLDIRQSANHGVAWTMVSWTEPTWSRYSGIVTMTSSHKPGSNFTIGEHTVIYTMEDFMGNIVTDSFLVTVEGMSV